MYGRCLYVGHTGQLCKNGWTDRDAVGGRLVWGQPQGTLHLMWGTDAPYRKNHFWRGHVGACCNIPPNKCIRHCCMPSAHGGRVHLPPWWVTTYKTCKVNPDDCGSDRRCVPFPNYFVHVLMSICSENIDLPTALHKQEAQHNARYASRWTQWRRGAKLHVFHTPLAFLDRIRDHRILRNASVSACR